MTLKSIHFFSSALLIVVAFLYVVDVQAACQDRAKNCANYPRSACEQYKEWAKRNCAKSCGICLDACSMPCRKDRVRRPDCSCQCKDGYDMVDDECVAKSYTCLTGWKHYIGDQTCLMLIGFRNTNNKVTWDSAKSQCEYFKGSLVVIKDQYKNAFVKEMIPKDQVIWIGLKNVAQNANNFQFQYVDDSNLGDYHPWLVGNPDNFDGDERCVTLLTRAPYGGRWNDLDCSATNGYICQMPATQDR